MTTYYKVLDHHRRCHHGGTGAWPAPGVWRTPLRDLEPCERGYHLCTLQHLPAWLGPRIWTAEVDPACQLLDTGDKLVVGRARLIAETRWDERRARVFAADCAAHVLSADADERLLAAVAVARRYARGDASAATARNVAILNNGSPGDGMYRYGPLQLRAECKRFTNEGVYEIDETGEVGPIIFDAR